MKKWQKGLALVFAGAMTASTLVACKPQQNAVATDPKTINVEMSKLSYGVAWAYEIKDKFEAAYAAEGYKVNILKPSSDMRNSVAIQQLAQGYDATKVDMYISGGLTSKNVGEMSEYGVICEEVSDLWEKKAIGYNGQEESKTLREKAVGGVYEGSKDIKNLFRSLF